MKPLLLIVVWFGPWPRWMNIHLETCRHNPEVDWLIVTDQAEPDSRPPNVSYLKTTLADFMRRVGDTIGLDLTGHTEAYKVCDLRPTFGQVFEREIAPYHSFGYADIDVFFGRIRQFYTDEVLRSFDVISTHPERISGHLAVFRNVEAVRLSYRRIRNWQRLMLEKPSYGLDERRFLFAFRSRWPLIRHAQALRWRTQFVEQYSTVDKPIPWIDGSPGFPTEWHWHDGKLTNTHDGDREFLYLHVMRWHSNRYRSEGAAPWPPLGDQLVQVDWRDVRETGFRISPLGIDPIQAVNADEVRGASTRLPSSRRTQGTNARMVG